MINWLIKQLQRFQTPEPLVPTPQELIGETMKDEYPKGWVYKSEKNLQRLSRENLVGMGCTVPEMIDNYKDGDFQVNVEDADLYKYVVRTSVWKDSIKRTWGRHALMNLKWTQEHFNKNINSVRRPQRSL